MYRLEREVRTYLIVLKGQIEWDKRKNKENNSYYNG
jgi:hypothetical protein